MSRNFVLLCFEGKKFTYTCRIAAKLSNTEDEQESGLHDLKNKHNHYYPITFE